MSNDNNMMNFSDEQIERMVNKDIYIMANSFNDLEGSLMMPEFNNVQFDSKNYHSQQVKELHHSEIMQVGSKFHKNFSLAIGCQ
jgi:hypothetical protein